MVKALCYVFLAVATAFIYSESQTSNIGPNASVVIPRLTSDAVVRFLSLIPLDDGQAHFTLAYPSVLFRRH